MLMDAHLEEIFIRKIINGEYAAETYLPPERTLATMYEVSRPVVHRAMIRLEGKGLITIMPRKGIRVNDFKRNAKLSTLQSIFDMEKLDINPRLNTHMLSFIRKILAMVLEEVTKTKSVSRVKRIDLAEMSPGKIFEWSQQYALTLDNPIYTMLINEFEVGIINAGKVVAATNTVDVFAKHINIIDLAMQSGDLKTAKEGLERLFDILFEIYPTQI
ncbi:GntR family transcriptional regulator [Fusibacter paucivorans]|uniref:GntR family transcriptional regulator n=1 Tax=Fusibacter paucivorans TaxID=76009 RepID=A0ABS5PU03_9FIRM|nr:GntR family transcriptional regulator [Fusibacter paucivorans]MBS7528650.1 GntR family transcriptional regulator [Fusibacter paucivorans]